MDLVDQADIYLGVFAFRYGYVPKGHEVSITEMEYKRAVERGIPRLIFLMHGDHPVKSADVETGEGAIKLEKFRQRVGQERVVNYFKSPADLRANVIDSLSHQARTMSVNRGTQASESPQYHRQPLGLSQVRPKAKTRAPALREARMKISIDPVISGRINRAWRQLTAAQQSQIAPAILKANQQAVRISQTGKAPATPAAPHHLMLARSALTNDSDQVVSSLEAGVVLDVGADGIIWGTGKYQQLDPGWAEALAVFLESLLPLIGGKHPVVSTPQTIPIPATVQIALAGDWGTGDWRTAANPAPSTDVRTLMPSLRPDFTIHLGGVYYAGTSDQEQHELVKLWPKGSIGSLALSSNHEMYSGAKPYFQAIANPPFEIQKGCSFFALQNNYWIIVGLDSAYYADENGLYMEGALYPANTPNAQNSFLLEQQANAQASGKKLILLTHHNGLDETGSSTTALYGQVMAAFPGGGAPAYWYWGHVHAAAVYQNQNIACRCCGHGGLPWGEASELANPNVLWYENRSANDPDIPQRVLNGFAVLSLNGPKIQETFYDENGGVAWRSS